MRTETGNKIQINRTDKQKPFLQKSQHKRVMQALALCEYSPQSDMGGSSN